MKATMVSGWGAFLFLAVASGVASADDSVCGEMPFWLPVATNGADVVALGEVEHVDLDTVRFLTTDTVTYITLRVETALKGPALGDSLVFWTAFAAKKGERVTSAEPPLPAYGLGDEVLVFAEADAAGKPYSRGMALQISDGVARTPEDVTYRRDGVPLKCYTSWVDSLVCARCIETLSSSADVVAVVRVESVAERETRESADLERVRAVVLRSLKGPGVGATVVLALPARGLWDVATLSPEDTALVFLQLREDGAHQVLGGREGVYLLDEETGLCHRSPRRNLIPTVPGEPSERATVLRDVISFDQLVRQVEESVN